MASGLGEFVIQITYGGTSVLYDYECAEYRDLDFDRIKDALAHEFQVDRSHPHFEYLTDKIFDEIDEDKSRNYYHDYVNAAARQYRKEELEKLERPQLPAESEGSPFMIDTNEEINRKLNDAFMMNAIDFDISKVEREQKLIEGIRNSRIEQDNEILDKIREPKKDDGLGPTNWLEQEL
jgi:hypothetical protein